MDRRQALKTAAVLGAGLALDPRRTLAQAPPPSEVDVGLDPGHSPVDVGASGAGVAEYEHTLDVAFRIKPLLEAAGLRVALTRVAHAPVHPTAHLQPFYENWRIEQTARIQSVGRAQIYVSIHFNGGPPSLRGTETYFNSEDGGPASARLAEALQGKLVEALWAFGYQTVDRGAKEDLTAGKPYGHFYSLRGPMPSALVEGLFLSNPTEAALLLREETREAIARGYVGGILEYLAVVASAPSTP